MKYNQIYCDLDDTLINTRETILKRIHILLSEFNIENIPAQMIYSLLGNVNRTETLNKYLQNPNIFWNRYEELRKESS